MSPNAIALSSSCRDLSTRFSSFSPRSIARSRASLTAACVPPTPPRAAPTPDPSRAVAAAAAALLPSPACRSPNKASRWSCDWAAALLPAARADAAPPPALDENDERALPNPPAPVVESRAGGGCRRGEGSTANTSATLFFDPPRDNRPSIPLADLPFGAPVLLALALLAPPEDCLLIAGGLARAETFTKRPLEPVSASQASSVSSDHRVNSYDDRGVKTRTLLSSVSPQLEAVSHSLKSVGLAGGDVVGTCNEFVVVESIGYLNEQPEHKK